MPTVGGGCPRARPRVYYLVNSMLPEMAGLIVSGSKEIQMFTRLYSFPVML
jgi:hypothetical protein